MGKQNGKEILRAYGLVTTLGLYMALCILIGLYAGQFADDYFHIAPLLTITGLLCGIGAAILGSYRLVMVTMKGGE